MSNKISEFINKWSDKIGEEYTLRGGGNYSITDVIDGETISLRRTDDGYRVEANLPQINDDGTIEWAFSSGGFFEKDLPVYYGTIPEARENNELELFKKSRKLNDDCAADIDSEINKTRFNMGMAGADTYDLKSALNSVTEKYGLERVSAVIAHSTNRSEWDGRWSRQNKDWAKTVETPKVDYIHISTHLAVLNGFVNHVRKAHQEAHKLDIFERDVRESIDIMREENDTIDNYFSSLSEAETAAFVKEIAETICTEEPYFSEGFSDHNECVKQMNIFAEKLIENGVKIAIMQREDKLFSQALELDNLYFIDAKNDRIVNWYFNPDSDCRGTLVQNINYEDSVLEAAKIADGDAKKFFELLESDAIQYNYDINKEDFAAELEELQLAVKHGKCGFIGETSETMNGLIEWAKNQKQIAQKSQEKPLKNVIDSDIGEDGYICLYNKYGDFLCEGKVEDLRSNDLWALLDEESSKVAKIETVIEGKEGNAAVIHLSNFPLNDRKNEQTAQKNNNLTEVFLMETKITARVTPIENGSNLKGSASITIGDQLSVHGIKVVQGEKGLFVSMPGEMGKNGKFYDTVLPKSKEAHALLESAVMSAYKDALAHGKQQKSELEPTQLSVKVSNFRDNPYENNIKGDCQITINDMFVIKGVKVIQGKESGLLGVALPSKQDQYGGYIPIANAITKDFYAQIKDVVLDHYQNRPQTLGNTSYGKLADKSLGEEILHKTYNSQFAEKIGEQLNADDVKWSAKLDGNNKTVIAVNKNDSEKLDACAEKAKSLVQGGKPPTPETPDIPTQAPRKK